MTMFFVNTVLFSIEKEYSVISQLFKASYYIITVNCEGAGFEVCGTYSALGIDDEVFGKFQ